MAGPWLVDGSRIASKIRSARGADDPPSVRWTSNPTRNCPNCQHTIDNDDVNKEWPGLPGGVKFDPTDQQIIVHLLAKVGAGDLKPHPFINEFIPTVEKDDGICYTHPQNLPGVMQDGSPSHFFHRAIKAYTTGTRKRRKINDGDFGDVRWHKTGRTKPVILDGNQKGCKKIMVLYMSIVRGGKVEKTNWVMHQYHLGTQEDERDGEYVVSKIFYQQQAKPSDQNEQDVPEIVNAITPKVDPVTPKSVTPEPQLGRRLLNFGPQPEVQTKLTDPSLQHLETGIVEEEAQHESEKPSYLAEAEADNCECRNVDNEENHFDEGSNWWDNESQFILDSQQLVEGLSLCDELLQSQSPNREEEEGAADDKPKRKPRLSDYAKLGPEDLKKDLEECQNLVLDPANIELDSPPEFRMSQLEFGSQDSFIAWGGGRI